MPVPWAGMPAEGMVTVTDRPPSLRGRAVAVPPWIAAMEATMVRPSPEPSWEVRSLSRWNGWKMRSASAGLMRGPVLATVAEDVLDTADPGDRRLHATLEPAVISGDPVLAERLIANLVDNAARYNAASGDIWISTRTAAGRSELTVANTGPLISPADADRIFQPFQRLSDRTSHDGFGLGLAIVASIAAIHGGTATACPRDHGGLTVTVTIPSAGAPAQGTGIQAAERPGVPRPR